MAYVRRQGGQVTGIYANPQPGAEEFIADDDAEVNALRTTAATSHGEQLADLLVAKGIITEQEKRAIYRKSRMGTP